MILFAVIAVLSFLFQLFLPWWTMAIASFIPAFFLGKKSSQVITGGFTACGLVWVLMALFVQLSKGNLMTIRIAELFSLPSPWLLFLVSFFIAGVVGGLAAYAGFLLKKNLTNNRVIEKA